MYNDYFGLNDAPFSIAPNPQYLYMTERHREALAHLLYGIRSDGGFILLTGEVGTGKTTVCRCLLEQMPPEVDTAFVLNPKLTAIELLATVCDDLGITCPDDASIKTLVDRLSRFLLDAHEHGRRTVLIIDEAQNLSTDVLEQLRLLTNLETNQRKLLQILLLGQPELLEILERKELRQLAQRITARFHLEALDRDEVERYIHHRLDVAGGKPGIFTARAVNRVYRLSGGIPRLINLICDRALLGTWAENRLKVDARTVDRAAAEIMGRRRAPMVPWRYSGIAAALVLAAVAVPVLLPRDEMPALPTETAAEAAINTDEEPAAADPEPAPAELPVMTTGFIDAPHEAASVDSLLSVEGDESQRASLARLLALWDVPLAGVEGDPCEVARQFELQCLQSLGSLRDLEHLDRPAAVRLTIAGLDHHLALTGLDEETVTLTSGLARFRLRREDMLRSWDGNYTLLWRPPPGYRLLQQGDRGEAVERLSRRLALVDGEASEGVAVFDAALEDRLKQFQVSVGLVPDGLAGAQTWIHLNQATGIDHPTLRAGGNT